MIFPGMDPYLEPPQLWTGVHASLIVYFREQLQPQLRPRYVAAIEERVYLEEADAQRVPDLWVRRRTGSSKRNGKVALLAPDAPVVVRVPREDDYLACVNRAQEIRDKFDLYPRTLFQRLPRIQIPLAGKDADVILDVQDALEKTWDAAAYDLRIQYDQPCDPPLSKKDQTWANDLIRKAKRKRGK